MNETSLISGGNLVRWRSLCCSLHAEVCLAKPLVNEGVHCCERSELLYLGEATYCKN